jgi:hypothetical protein
MSSMRGSGLVLQGSVSLSIYERRLTIVLSMTSNVLILVRSAMCVELSHITQAPW